MRLSPKLVKEEIAPAANFASHEFAIATTLGQLINKF